MFDHYGDRVTFSSVEVNLYSYFYHVCIATGDKIDKEERWDFYLSICPHHFFLSVPEFPTACVVVR